MRLFAVPFPSHPAGTRLRSLRLQLWSYNFHPEPSGIAPLSTVWAEAMRARGHEVTVVAAQPHYPEPIWKRRLRPYRERRGDIEVLRLPLWVGRETGAHRVRQELSYMTSLAGITPLLPRPDAIVAVTPSFPALLPAMIFAETRRVPWIIWLQDILPDGAATTGIVKSGPLLQAARAFERLAYASADRIAVISDAFQRNLMAKGVDPAKLVRIYNPSAVPVPDSPRRERPEGRTRLLVMGNIGYSQGLASVVRALEGSDVLTRRDAELRIAGAGVARAEVEAEICDNRVRLLGLLLGQAMEDELATATLGLVTQRPGVQEFNLPSKLMNYMAHGVPVLAVVNPASETARIVEVSEAGWVLDSSRLDRLPAVLAQILDDERALRRCGVNAHRTALREFAPDRIAEQYEKILLPSRTRRA